MTLDGFCDHTAVIADEELHRITADQLDMTDTIVYGRTTYQLMEDYWPLVAKNKTGSPTVVEFAEKLDKKNRIVISKTLKEVKWHNTRIIREIDEIKKLKQQESKDIMIGGPSLISQLTEQNLVDEFYLFIQPIILGKGLTLFKNISERHDLEYLDSKILKSGVVMIHYKTTK